MASGIYYILNTVNNKRYIGKSNDVERRLRRHKLALSKPTYARETNRLLYNSVNKYGISNFIFDILETFPLDSIRLSEREMYWIDFYNVCDRAFGYNLLHESIGFSSHSEETKRTISIKLTGLKRTAEQSKRQSERQKGLPQSPETIAKRAAKNTGKKQTAEHKAKILLKIKGLKRSNEVVENLRELRSLYSYEQYNLQGNLLHIYLRSKNLVSNGFDKSAVNKVCLSENKTYKGFVWKRIPKLPLPVD